MNGSPILRRSLSRLALTSVLLGAPILAGSVLLPVSASAQTETLRSVDGKVVDKQNAPLKGAVVYLKDDHALSVKSYISGDDGGYHFGQLSSGTDYTLWAESGGKKSSTKSISSFDSRNKLDYTLKIDK